MSIEQIRVARDDLEREEVKASEWMNPEGRRRSLVTRYLNRIDTILDASTPSSQLPGKTERKTDE